MVLVHGPRMDDTTAADSGGRLTPDPWTDQRGGAVGAQPPLQPAVRNLGLAPSQRPIPADCLSGFTAATGAQRAGATAPAPARSPPDRLSECRPHERSAGSSSAGRVLGAAASGDPGEPGPRGRTGSVVQGVGRHLSLLGLPAGARRASQILGCVSRPSRGLPEFWPGRLAGGPPGSIHRLVAPTTARASAVGGQ